ncbi:MAG: DUF357 domain-containing protein [Candidatus Aenigmarchaeota archaeon]|nr:DUF357 domain-containing protein [Candidatus Aenigmarchaeota archaeon]
MENELRKETEKWLKKIRKDIKKIELVDKRKEDLMENVRAYVKDCEYFLGKKDLIRSFEAVVWAWSWIEILKELKIIKA